jgi:phage shock protein PspC (stress-responsive transcriptional regulator)
MSHEEAKVTTPILTRSGRPQLCRPDDDRWVAGVCSGLARKFGLSSNVMRLIFVVSCLLPGPQFLVYLMLWLIIPSESRLRSRLARHASRHRSH